MTNTQPSEDVIARLRQLESRLSSLSGVGIDVQILRDALTSHHERRGKQYALVLREASAFALDLTRAVETRVASRTDRVAERAIARLAKLPLPRKESTFDRAENRLGQMEEELPGMSTKVCALLDSVQRRNARITAAGIRLDEVWSHQDSSNLGAWRLVMCAVSAQIERDKRDQPAFTEQYRGQPTSFSASTPASAFHCSRCQTFSVRRIRRESLLEQILRIVFVAPYRCSTCAHRSYHFRYTVKKAG